MTGGFHPNARDRDLAFTAKDEPATLPRVEQLIIITEISPWCTVVKNERGVTLGDICTAVYKECLTFSGGVVDTETIPFLATQKITSRMRNSQLCLPEFRTKFVALLLITNKVTGTIHQLLRAGIDDSVSSFYSAYFPLPSDKHTDWLRERTFFEGLRRHDSYVISRLGFKAGNIFVMDLVQ